MKDPELRLIVAALRAAYSGGRLAADDGRGVRWDRFLALAGRHRVHALCWQGLGDARQHVPQQIAEGFASRSAAIVEANLRSATECAQLHARFNSAGIQILFLKGLTVGALAYPDPFLKMSWDIDMLVAPERIRDTTRLLREVGYVPVIPPSASDDRIQRWHAIRKESVWFRDPGSFTLDLHTRLTDNPRMLPAIGMHSPSRRVPIANKISLPTLCKDELFAYLCVHGASSAWFRLKWICDVAALLDHEHPDEIQRLYERTLQLGAGRAADQALLLADNLFGIAKTGELRKRLGSMPVGRWLASVARSQLENEVEPTDRFLGTASIHISQPFLQSSWRFKLSETARQFRTAFRSAA